MNCNTYYYIFIEIYPDETKYTKLLEVITPVVNNEVCKRTLTNNRIVIDDRVLCLDLNEMYHHDICQVYYNII